MRGRFIGVIVDFSETSTSVVGGGALIARLAFLVTGKTVIVIYIEVEAIRVINSLIAEVERTILEFSIRNRSSASLVRKL